MSGAIPPAPRGVAFRGAGGLTVAGDAYGPAEGAPVVLLHGAGQTRHAWGETARALAARGYHVVSLDLRGHGDSAWSDYGDYTLSALLTDLRAVLATLGRPAILIGASLGGLTALLAAGEGPHARIRALVLVDVTPNPDPARVAPIRAFMAAHTGGFTDVEEAAAAVSAYRPGRGPRSDVSGLLKNLRVRNGRLHWHWDPALVSSISGHLEGARRLVEAARQVTVPTLLVRGAHSELVGEQDAAELEDLIPHVAVVTVDGARHMVAGDQNTEFGAALLQHLERVAPP
ncbi:alpha/beta fold hydrolase [Phenylobacterium sp. J367]|uniref:alpha/beta fold hydrolase n=1 Tax=Phenylobacterium sp. J367 TaxID=2898435 RepID=UPI0021514E96|nr:alpha/beta hydrolase [Phenylobacterium sp. J367]MCR5879585.1 alpha/beta hydrolase [Phenylobacterium sp. J367]